MKRGRDDEKRMEPMFPRLHINDTEKGCPRAPPRNKMALYEQFTVPLKRSTPGVLPLPTNISRKPLTAPSSSQVDLSFCLIYLKFDFSGSSAFNLSLCSYV